MRESQIGRRHLGRIRLAVLLIALASTAPAFVDPTGILPWLWLVGLVLVQAALALGGLTWSGPGLLRVCAAADVLFLASAGALVGTDLFGLVVVPVIWVAAWLSAADVAWAVVGAAAISGFSAPDANGGPDALSSAIVRAAVLGLVGAATHATATIRDHQGHDWRALIDLPARRRAARAVDDVPRIAEVLQAFLGAARALVFVPGPGGLSLEDAPIDMSDAEADAASELPQTDLLRASLTSGRPIAVRASGREPRLPRHVATRLAARTLLVAPVPLPDAVSASAIVLTRSTPARAFTDEDAGLAALIVAASLGPVPGAVPVTTAVEPIIAAGMQTAFEAADAAAIVIDPKGRLVTFNAVAQALFGLGAEAAGEPLVAKVPDEAIQRLVGESVGLNAPRVLSVAPPSAPWAEAEVMPLLAGDQRIGSLVLARPRDEDAVRGALDRVLVCVSHELRTPLTAIRAYIDTLIRVGDSDIEMRRQFLNTAHEQTARLSDAVEALLAAADGGGPTQESGRPGAVGPAVRAAAERLSYCLTDRELGFSLLEQSPAVRPPEGALEFGVRHLLLDALTRSARDAPVAVQESADDTTVLLTVGFRPDASLGAHIATAEAPGLLLGASPRPGGGMGLGLYLARRALEPYGAQIEAQLTGGEQALWRLQLPRA